MMLHICVVLLLRSRALPVMHVLTWRVHSHMQLQMCVHKWASSQQQDACCESQVMQT